MKSHLHRDAAAGQWWKMSLYEQLGNIGSEVHRAILWKHRNQQIAQKAIERALDLMDLTIADPRYKRPVSRMREITRTREVMVDFLAGSNEYRSTADSLQKYFDAFAVAANLAKDRLDLD